MAAVRRGWAGAVMAQALSCRDGDAKRDGAMFRHEAPFHHVWRPKKRAAPAGRPQLMLWDA
ncbi:hypothetical protein A6768_23910 [Sphingobium yanoikuyae]|uniref:Uncharacterized protein n=1 Tax=Sphingobium yanoikuyae TaxID=13690 RepID=A0A291N676_SPHYA|nr:hypothetical protein A6768_23910 [Sphingobium yanoikuyae]